MRWLLPFLLLWPSVCSGQSNAEIPEELDLKKALEMAVANNPQLKAVRNDIEITEADRIDASKRLNPGFSAYFEDYRLFHSDIGPFFQTQEITVRLDQEIETGGKMETANASCRTEEPGAKGANGQCYPCASP